MTMDHYNTNIHSTYDYGSLKYNYIHYMGQWITTIQRYIGLWLTTIQRYTVHRTMDHYNTNIHSTWDSGSLQYKHTHYIGQWITQYKHTQYIRLWITIQTYTVHRTMDHYSTNLHSAWDNESLKYKHTQYIGQWLTSIQNYRVHRTIGHYNTNLQSTCDLCTQFQLCCGLLLVICIHILQDYFTSTELTHWPLGNLNEISGT